MTVAEACRRGESELARARIGSPSTDARLLMAHVLGLRPATLPPRYRDALPAHLAQDYAAAVRRRACREPLAYITGETEFMGLRFACGPGALVPRPDTEVLVEVVAELVGGLDPAAGLIADVGTGTGCVGISLARLLPGGSVLLTDVSAEALELAAENARGNAVEDRVRLLRGADLAPIHRAGLAAEVAVLVSNPPYIPTAEIATLEPEVGRHEPAVALDGGPDGLDVYRRLVAGAAELPALSVVAFEVGIGQAGHVAEMLGDGLPGWESLMRPDLAGIPRVVAACRGPVA